MLNMKLTAERNGFCNLTQADFNRILKLGMKDMGENWITEILPQRFSTSGSNIYKLQQRKWKYIKRAKQINPGWRPLVLTGALAAKSTSSSRVTLVSNEEGTYEAAITVPRAHPTRQNTADEIIETTETDMEKLKRLYRSEVTIQMSIAENNKTKTTSDED